MGGGKIRQEGRLYNPCKICGKLVNRNLGMIRHMKVHNKDRDKEQSKLEIDFSIREKESDRIQKQIDEEGSNEENR